MHLGAVHDHAGRGVVAHLLEREGSAYHVPGELLSPLRVGSLHTFTVVHREARVSPGEQALGKLRGKYTQHFPIDRPRLSPPTRR